MAAGFDGNIYVLDTELAVVQVFTPEGELVSRWPLGVKDFDYMSTICANPDGDVFVVEEQEPTLEGTNLRIYKYSPGGDLIKTWGKPNDGDSKYEDGEFGGGTDGIACGPDGRVYISDVGADRVQVFNSGAKYLFSFTGPPGSAPNGAVALGTDGIFVTDSSSGSVSKFNING
jgi:sugar lactone lactonase YvrE